MTKRRESLRKSYMVEHELAGGRPQQVVFVRAVRIQFFPLDVFHRLHPLSSYLNYSRRAGFHRREIPRKAEAFL